MTDFETTPATRSSFPFLAPYPQGRNAQTWPENGDCGLHSCERKGAHRLSVANEVGL